MKQREDWDADEHDALSGFDDQLEAIRRRQAVDPPLELLASAHVAADEPFDDVTAQRVWLKIERSVGQQSRRSSGAKWAAGALAVAATIVVAVMVSRPGQPAVPVSQPSATPAPAEVIRIEFTKPDVKLSPAVLSWRGDDTASAYARDLAPALEAYRSNNYEEAETQFAAIASQYPNAIEGPFYLGVVRMLRGDFSGAIAPLTSALALPEPTFVDDAAWFLGVAEQRSGRPDEAMRRFESLCNARGPRSTDACEAIQLLSRSR